MNKMKITGVIAAVITLLSGCGQAADGADSSTVSTAATQDNSAAAVTENSDTLPDAIPANADTPAPDSQAAETSDSSVQAVTDNSSAPESDPNRPATGTAKVHVLCAGDNLIHDNIYTEAWNKGGDHYDFSGMYDEIKPYTAKADLAIINQETLVNDAFNASTYPMFSTPTEDGDALIDAGWNIVSMCNNHVLDMGSEGLISSLDYWDSKNIIHYGAYRDEQDSELVRTANVNGVTIAFLGYMEHTNGIFLDDDDKGKVIYLDDEETIERQIKYADEIADVVIVSCHFGTEVIHDLNDQQVTLAPKLAEWGADLIIGTQAHCVSTCGYIDKSDGTQAFCYYGLGNFFHTMYDRHSAAGIMGDLDVVYDFENDTVTFENVKAIPVISHFEADSYDSMWYNCKVYPLAKYDDDMFAKNFNDGVTREQVDECLSNVPEEFLSVE